MCGRERHLQVKVRGGFLRQEASHRPLFLIVVRGKHNARTRREPLVFLVDARPTADGRWRLPLPLETLLFWAWQRWEVEVCHRELKSIFDLGDKQCFNPLAAVASVQWSAWIYILLLLAGYRTFGLTPPAPVPTRWWRGSQRWSLNTLWRAYRIAFWQQHDFHPLCSPPDWAEKNACCWRYATPFCRCPLLTLILPGFSPNFHEKSRCLPTTTCFKLPKSRGLSTERPGNSTTDIDR